MQARASKQQRYLRGCLKGFALRKVVAHGVFQWPPHQPAQHLFGHIHQHQAHQNLAGMKAVTQPGCNTRPRHAASHACQQNGQHNPAARIGIGCKRHAASRNRTRNKLPLGTNVPDVGAKAQRQPQANQQQGRSLEQQLTPCVAAFNRLPEKYLQTLPRVFAQSNKQQHRQQHG